MTFMRLMFHPRFNWFDVIFWIILSKLVVSSAWWLLLIIPFALASVVGERIIKGWE